MRMKGWSGRKSIANRAVENDFKMKLMLMRNREENRVVVSGGGGGGEVVNGGGGGIDEGGDGRTVVVGLKLDLQSRELLTWALVKVAQPGDRVIALHILNDNEVVDREGKSSLLSLVKAFDSVLEVYEGFCNLKQVDLKLKICRGSSIRRVLVREAKAYVASKVIVGTSRNHHVIGAFSSSLARYCAKKLPKDCWVLAVNNGKVVFQRESSAMPINASKGADDDHWRRSLFGLIHRSVRKNTKLLTNVPFNHENQQYSAGGLLKTSSGQRNCSVCTATAALEDTCSTKSADETSNDDAQDSSLALVPVQTLEAASSSVSLLIRELPELRSGWPLLRRAILPHMQTSKKFLKKELSVVQWATLIATRQCSAVVHPDHQPSSHDQAEDCASNLDGKSGAIVLVGTTPTASPDDDSNKFPEELESLHEKYSSSCRLFRYQELLMAASKFIPERLIGKGGSSHVYKGCLPDGKELAVKILKPSEDALKEFVTEIEIINTLNHKNIISLFGFCYEDNNLLMVYNFLSRGSLEENLHGDKKNRLSFGWGERYKVALGVAEALDYLHSSNTQPVIHRDVKSSNILLSDDFEPQLSDFGLAIWASSSNLNITCTDVAGTFGYLAPEYFMYGKVTEKVDVYAFGVVLLELLSGRKPICSECPKGQESLVMWAKPILDGGKVSQLLDPSLRDKYDHDQMERMVIAATICIRRSPRTRPRMSLVLKLLQGDPEVTKWSRLQVSASDELDGLDEEVFSPRNIQSHLNLALLDVEDDSISVSSIDQSVSLEDYLQGRWSRSSSFD